MKSIKLEKNDLMSLLKKMFLEQDGDSEESDMRYDVDPTDGRGGKKRRSSDDEFMEEDEEEPSEGVDDRSFEMSEDDEPQEDSVQDMEDDPMIPKDQRKRMAVAVLSKRMSKPKK